ncbi:FAD-dependent oxidoreductase [Leifsonia shinshuensis]|uniref:FAD-dependent oxidoreductase n=1 Tax=Leifsonia shinshuensis TaxID=150026 RepID=UPI001CA5DCF3|nr:FAD-dependent oxidoreductase [Leifsonia shinshuensis]
MSTAELEVDLLVVGWGKAGKTLARRYATAGRSVALVERDPAMYGGTCINIACVPTKNLVVAAEARRPDDDPQGYFTAAVAGRDELVHGLNAANHRMLEGLATLVDGTARFIGPRQVDVRTADGEALTIRAAAVVIGTGTVPARPELPGLDLPGVYDSTTIQHAEPFPRRLAVIGGGFVGLEFAGMFQRFGSQVTVLDPRPDILPRLEPVVVETVREVLGAHGVTLRTSTRVSAVERAPEGLRVLLEDGAVEVDAVLVATGRTPVTADLGLESAGVDVDDRGYIRVDDRLRTSADGVFAVGDVNGGPQFTYISLDDNRVVWDQLAGEGRRTTADRVAVPNTTFITPPLSQVGLTPAEARRRGHDVLYAAKKVAAIAAMPRPKILGDADGVITFTVDAASRRLLGATLFCVDSQEVINLVALAMRAGVTADELMNGIWTHPSSTEALNEVLAELAPYDEG